MSIPVTHCLRCGVCCHSHLDTYVRVTGTDWERLGAHAQRVAHFIGNDTYVRVTGTDWERLGAHAQRVAHFIGNRAYMRMSEGHCAALAVRNDAAHPGAREFFCTVYAVRPQVCRDLAQGSPECEGELAAKAERVAAYLKQA